PSRSTVEPLMFVRKACRVPRDVEFRLPVDGETMDNPPLGFFTCYEAHLLRARLWFPIPSVIVWTLNRFGLSIGQVAPRGLQHIVGILILSYEFGIDLTASHFENLLSPQRGRTYHLYYILRAKNLMAVIIGLASHEKMWKDAFFFVRANEASIERECIADFQCEWLWKGTVAG